MQVHNLPLSLQSDNCPYFTSPYSPLRLLLAVLKRVDFPLDTPSEDTPAHCQHLSLILPEAFSYAFMLAM